MTNCGGSEPKLVYDPCPVVRAASRLNADQAVGQSLEEFARLGTAQPFPEYSFPLQSNSVSDFQRFLPLKCKYEAGIRFRFSWFVCWCTISDAPSEYEEAEAQMPKLVHIEITADQVEGRSRFFDRTRFIR